MRTNLKPDENQHKSSFSLVHRKKDTKLSEHIWELNDKNIEYTIQWEIIKKVKPYTPEKSVCTLCLGEKYQILTKDHSLNKRKEIFSHCVHRKCFLLSNVNTNHRPLPTHSHLKRAARPRNSGVMANQI